MEKRLLRIPTLFDRAVQALLLFALEPVVQTKTIAVLAFGKLDLYTMRPTLASMFGKRLVLEVDIGKLFESNGFNIPMETRKETTKSRSSGT
jgi:hypothetical protein